MAKMRTKLAQALLVAFLALGAVACGGGGEGEAEGEVEAPAGTELGG